MLVTLVACSGKHRPFAGTPIEGSSGSSGTGVPPVEESDETSPASPAEPAATGGEPLGGATVDTLSRPDDSVQGSESLGCQAEAAACARPDAGPIPAACAPTGPRDCTSDKDNDCDGQPDSAVDDVCRCVPGMAEPCGEHPGVDGRGQCRAGIRTCVATEGNVSSDWGACEGSQGPQEADSCVPGDDGDCDGFPNEGCDCVDGFTQPCGPPTELGVCQRGTQTCVNGLFAPCLGAVFGTARDCRSQQDNDCDGRPDSTIDNVCTCTVGDTRVCGDHPGQDGNGRCRAGQRRCEAGLNNASSFFGACIGSVEPLLQDSCANEGDDANCNGVNNDGCGCIVGQGNGPCSEDANNPRCNGQGQCVPCQTDGDCSLVSGGRNACNAGQCVPGPFDCSRPAPPAGPEPLKVNGTGFARPPLTGGSIANGRYTLTRLTYYNELPTTNVGEIIDFRDGSYRRRRTVYSADHSILNDNTEAGSYEIGTIGFFYTDGVACSLGNLPLNTIEYEFNALAGFRLEINGRLENSSVILSYERTDIPE